MYISLSLHQVMQTHLIVVLTSLCGGTHWCKQQSNDLHAWTAMFQTFWWTRAICVENTISTALGVYNNRVLMSSFCCLSLPCTQLHCLSFVLPACVCLSVCFVLFFCLSVCLPVLFFFCFILFSICLFVCFILFLCLCAHFTNFLSLSVLLQPLSHY